MCLKVIQKIIPEALREAVSKTTTDKKKNLADIKQRFVKE
jgi:hypothetical protein